ncbi:A24 family peptidase [Candidatus Liberibacter brunswickensis]|uniref:A24 family peptidase n=1 Tax=Candidatus Liberibacter brunswickensis TaxID=1968796 RepID=UPI002FE072EB
MIFSAILLIPVFCLVFAAMTDLFYMVIPNRVSIIMLGSFLLISCLLGLDYGLILSHLLVGLLVFAVCFVCFIFNIMGGGDVKLLTATSVWFGWASSLVIFLCFVSVCGGILSLLILVIRLITRYTPLFDMFIPKTFLMKNKIPYGIAISIGGLISYPDSYFFKVALLGLSQ